jgi:hypothetical protein
MEYSYNARLRVSFGFIGTADLEALSNYRIITLSH